VDDTDQRVRRAEAGLRVFSRRVLEAGPDWVEDRSRPGVWAMSTPYPVAFLNGAAWARPDEVDVEVLVAEVVEDFASRGLPWSWSTTPGSTSPALEDALRRAGLTESVEPLMHLELPTALPDLGAHEVVLGTHADHEGLAAMTEAFGGPPDMVEVMATMQQCLRTGTELTASVSDGQRVLGVAQGFTDDGVVVIANVAVREEARGRGIGTAVTAAVLAAAQERGATDAVLVSSELGHSVYRGLGFVDVGTRSTWEWDPPEDEEPGPGP
jgi:ribosomal protein S18 acetylase RimI-like enzyme